MKVSVVLDVEMCRVRTTSIDFPCKNEMIQIGAVMLDESFALQSKFSTYVKPRFGKIDHNILTLTGISERDIKDAPDIEDALKQMLLWIGENDVTFYSWSSTDYYQIAEEIRLKCKEDLCWEKLLDQANWVDYQESLGKRLGMERPLKLSEALELAEIDTEGRFHDGLDDAYNTALMIAKLESNKDYQTLIEKLREKEKTQEPLTTSLGSMLQGFSLKTE